MGKVHIKKSVRGRLLSRSQGRYRIVVTRSAQHIYAQLRDPDGRVLGGVSSCTPKIRDQLKYGGNIKAAKVVGQAFALLVQGFAKKMKEPLLLCFDRGGYKYHGRVAALADAAREAGLVF
jgi:large subunit ribosomal protein L18